MNNNKKTFKDFISEDLDVFFNLDEMAEKATINGEKMIIMRAVDENNPTDKSKSISGRYKQVAEYDVLFYVRTECFEHIPQIEMMMNFNNEDYFIGEVKENMGLLTIGLTRNES